MPTCVSLQVINVKDSKFIYSTVCQLMSHITTGLKQLSNGSKRNLFVVSIMDLQVMYVNI